MRGDGFVDAGHEAGRFSQGGAEAAVVGDVRETQRAALAVLQPLLRRAVAADGEAPRLRRDALERLRAVDPHPARRRALRQSTLRRSVADLLDAVRSRRREGGRVIAFRFHHVQGGKAPAQAGQGGERRAARERHAREVRLQEGRVAAAVFRAVENGVDVTEHVFGAEGGFEVARAVGNEGEAECFRARLDEARSEVRLARLAEALRPFRRVKVEGEEGVDFLERHRVVLRKGARNEDVLPASRYLRRSRRREAQIRPCQHVAHNPFPPVHGDVAVEHGRAHVERAVENGRDPLPPGTVCKLALGAVVLPLVLRAQAP